MVQAATRRAWVLRVLSLFFRFSNCSTCKSYIPHLIPRKNGPGRQGGVVVVVQNTLRLKEESAPNISLSKPVALIVV